MLKGAIVGFGFISGKGHYPAYLQRDDVEIVAVADLCPARLESARAAAPKARLYPTWQELLDQERGLDFVDISTPPDAHAEIALAALARGAHVLCEKPLAVSLAAADALVDRAAASNRLLQVGFKNRFSPLVEALRELVVGGRIGRPLVVRIGSFDEAYQAGDTLHTDRIRSFLEHGPPVVHDGAHAADLLGWLLGPPERVTATALRSDPSFPAPNYHAALIEYADGSLAKLEVGWWFPHLWDGELQVYGARGAADLSRPRGVLRFHDGTHEERVRCDEDWQTICFRRQLDAFVEAIETGVQRGADAAAGRDALALTLAVADAAETAGELA